MARTPKAEEAAVEEAEVEETEDVEPAEAEDEPEVEEAEAEEAEEEEIEPTFEKRFTQFGGESPEEYLTNLEEGYANSSREAIRLRALNTELQARLDSMMGQLANDPQFRADGTQPASDPAVAFARQAWEDKNASEYQSFVTQHPELETDPALSSQVQQTLAAIAKAHLDQTGRYMTMEQGLRAAWISLGLPLESKEEATRMAVKRSASQARTATGGQNAVPKKSQYSKEAIDAARRMLPGGESMSNEQIEEKLAEYATA